MVHRTESEKVYLGRILCMQSRTDTPPTFDS